MLFFDPRYFLFIAPALALSLWASWRVKTNFKKYSNVRTMRGMTGSQVAEEMMRQAGIEGVSQAASIKRLGRAP